MTFVPTYRTLRAYAAAALVLLALALFAACGGGDENGERTATPEPTATAAATAPSPTVTPRLSEMGEAPIFWRTEDNFESLRAGEPYKVVFRITSGYDEETLHVAAFREGSDAAFGDARFGFAANRVEPGGEEAPGSYYAVNLELPEPGIWRVTVFAGEDEVTITVDVQPAS